MLANFTLETFLPLVDSRAPAPAGSTFRVRVSADRMVDVLLVEARADGAGNNPFTLVFRGAAHSFLPQGTYAFTHEQLGEFDLFISPVARNAETFTAEAVFNRRLPAR